MDFYSIIPSPLGDILLTSDGKHLTGLWFASERGTDGLIPNDSLPLFGLTADWLRRYFRGEAPDPSEIPILLRGSAFAMSVWEQLCKIPYGETVTYGHIARSIGCRSAQAVGGAVGRNPISIIVPCHRVIGSSGALVGYAGGMDRKIALLKTEGIMI